LLSKSSFNALSTNLFIQQVSQSAITFNKAKSVPLGDLKEIERHIMMNVKDYFLTEDLPFTIAGFIILGHIPRDIINEVQKEQKIGTFAGEGCLNLLDCIMKK